MIAAAVALALAIRTGPEQPIPPTPSPSAQPSQPVAAPTVSPTPALTPLPATPTPSAAPTPAFRYIYTPAPGSPSPAPGAPHIVEIDFTDQNVHENSDVVLRVLTSPAVSTVIVSAMGHDAAIPQIAAGVWTWQGHIPSVPFFFLNRIYNVEVRALSSDGRADAVTMPVRLAH